MKGSWNIGFDEGTQESYIVAGVRWRNKSGNMFGLSKRFRFDEDAHRFLTFMSVWFEGLPVRLR